MQRAVLMLCFAVSLVGQQGPANLDFKHREPGGTPTGWSWSEGPGYVAATTEFCRTSRSTCVSLRNQSPGNPAEVGRVMQSFDAVPIRGKEIRYRAWLRVDGLGGAQLFLRVDRPSGAGFQEYSLDQPVRSRDWIPREIIGRIDDDATRVTIGVMFRGVGVGNMAEPEFGPLLGE